MIYYPQLCIRKGNLKSEIRKQYVKTIKNTRIADDVVGETTRSYQNLAYMRGAQSK